MIKEKLEEIEQKNKTFNTISLVALSLSIVAFIIALVPHILELLKRFKNTDQYVLTDQLEENNSDIKEIYQQIRTTLDHQIPSQINSKI